MLDKSKIRELLLDAAQRGAEYCENIASRNVAPTADALQASSYMSTQIFYPGPTSGIARDVRCGRY
jgi:hypothetical protein